MCSGEYHPMGQVDSDQQDVRDYPVGCGNNGSLFPILPLGELIGCISGYPSCCQYLEDGLCVVL